MRAPYNRSKGTAKLPKTPRKRQTLIANDMHSPAGATTLKCATSFFLIANEFHFHGANFWRIFARRIGHADAPSLHQEQQAQMLPRRDGHGSFAVVCGLRAS